MGWFSTRADRETSASGRRASNLRKEFEAEALPHLDSMYATALRLTRSPSDAQDLVQDTLLRAYRYYDRFEAGTNMKAWLLRIETNMFINRYRRSVRERAALEGTQGAAVGEGVMSRAAMRRLSDPIGDADRRLLSQEIQQALDALPEDQRLMVVLADVEELSYREIADVVGCPIGTVMSRLHRARRDMKARLIEQAVSLGIVESPAEPAKEEAPGEPVSLSEYRRRKEAM